MHTSLSLETLELVYYLAQIVISGGHLGSKSAFILAICWKKKQLRNHSAFKLWPRQMADLNIAHLFTPARNLGHYAQCSVKS